MNVKHGSCILKDKEDPVQLPECSEKYKEEVYTVECRRLFSNEAKLASSRASTGEVLTRRARDDQNSVMFFEKGKELQDWLCVVIKDGPDISEITHWVPMLGLDELLREIGNVKLLTHYSSH
jgi:hypothetical protein